MQAIVEDALNEAEEHEREAVDDIDDDEVFGTPTCGLIGFGQAGIKRVELIDDADTTAIIGDPSTLDGLTNDGEDNNQIPVVEKNGATEFQVLSHDSLASAVTDAVGAPDIVGVTGHLETTWSVQLLATVCRQFPDDTTVVAVPSIPAQGLSKSAKTVFLGLTSVANTTVPFDLDMIADMTYRDPKPAGNDPLAITNDLSVDLLNSVFDTFRSSLTAPPLPFATAYKLFETGGITVLCRGTSTDSVDPKPLVEHTASNDVCDGDIQTATGGFGFVRFDEQFTLGQFESLDETARKSLVPRDVADDRWVFCGDCSLQESNGYQLLCLLVDIDIESLGFI